MSSHWNQYPAKRLGWNPAILGSGVAGLCLAMAATGSSAQQISVQPMISVPPPPPIVPVPTMAPPTGVAPLQRETVFQAPINFQRANLGRYLVYVNGDSSYLLQQVQTVEPKAFIQQYQGRSVIQVGTFSEEANARRQVEVLRSQGIMANIAQNALTPPSMNRTSSPYLVVIPGRREDLPNLAQRATSLGVRQESMQLKDAPLGPHVEIGPFSDYNEAKDVSHYLRGGGLDSRVFFNK